MKKKNYLGNPFKHCILHTATAHCTLQIARCTLHNPLSTSLHCTLLHCTTCVHGKVHHNLHQKPSRTRQCKFRVFAQIIKSNFRKPQVNITN